MQRTVKIGDVDVEMRATAATAIRYRNIFQGDIMKELMAMNPNDIDMAVIEKIQQVGFIMAKTAEGADMNALSVDDYMKWLDQFDSMDMMQAAKDIITVYIHQKAGQSELKKRVEKNPAVK